MKAEALGVEDPDPVPEQVAAVDLGSNSFHMIVARVGHGELVVVDRLREMVRLAAGLDRSRRLTAAAQARALACLERFGQRVRHLPRQAVRAVGTNTLRSAHNASAFVSRGEAALGHPIDTISGIEEARLVYLGVSRSLPDRGGRRLVLDIGGGSTEVIIGEHERPLVMDSLYLGCVSMLLPLVDAIPKVRGKVGAPRRRPESVTADKAYHSLDREISLWMRGIEPLLPRRGTDEDTSLGTLRWVVERTIAWLHQFRRLRVRHERRADIHQAFLSLGCILICFRTLDPLFC